MDQRIYNNYELHNVGTDFFLMIPYRYKLKASLDNFVISLCSFFHVCPPDQD